MLTAIDDQIAYTGSVAYEMPTAETTALGISEEFSPSGLSPWFVSSEGTAIFIKGEDGSPVPGDVGEPMSVLMVPAND